MDLLADEIHPSDTSSVEVQEDTVTQKNSFFYKVLHQSKPVQFIVFPMVYYTPETNVMFGAAGVVSFKIDKNTSTSSSYVIPSFSYSINKQMNIRLQSNIFSQGNKHQWDIDIMNRFMKMPYLGIGNKLEKDNKELVDIKELYVKLNYYYRFDKPFFIGGKYHSDYIYDLQAEPNGLLDTNVVMGKSGGFVQGLGVNLGFDNRDNVYFPYKGNYLSLEATGYPTWMGSKYEFASVKAEYRSFLNIKRKVILASQILAQMSFGDIPFYLMPRLGGEYVLRGYIAGTSLDKFLFNLQGELRVPVNRFIFSGFFGSGITGGKFTDYFNVKDYTYSIGGGVRFKPFVDRNVVLRLDVGFWQKTYGVYFVFNEAF